jgi:hypothetical protein
MIVDERADLDEQAGTVAGHVDVTRNPEIVAPELGRLALQQLLHTVKALRSPPVFGRARDGTATLIESFDVGLGSLVSRDFRDLVLWDRTRSYPARVHGWPANKSRGQSRGVLPWEKVTTIVLHTSDVDGMHPDRWLGVPCHVAVADDASVVLCHELNTYLWAAHTANSFSCSLEIAGRRTITAEQTAAGRIALRYMVGELLERRPGPVYIMPHRFSHASRLNDPGPEIWRALGEWAIAELGLLLGPVVGSGRGLPW